MKNLVSYSPNCLFFLLLLVFFSFLGSLRFYMYWYWRRLLRVPRTARIYNQFILKDISPEYSLEELMLKLQYFGLLMRRTDIGKDRDAGKDWRQEKGATEDEMVRWHHWLDGYEFEQAPRVGDGQGGLACCSPWGRKESNIIEQLNSTEEKE